MRQSNLISSIWKSFYSKALYQDVCHNWGFSVVVYLFLLIVIYGGIASYNHEHGFFKTFNLTMNEIVTQIPTGEISKGTMKIQEQSPHAITLHSDELLGADTSDVTIAAGIKNNQSIENPAKNTLTPIAVFDMTNQATPETTPATFIFHSNGYYFITEHKTNAPIIQIKKVKSLADPGTQNAYQFKPYSSKLQIHFSKEQATHWAEKMKWILPILLLLLVCIGQFIFKLLQAIFYAFLALIFSAFYKITLTYGAAYRLSIVAMTPAFFIITLSGFFLDIRHPWFIALLAEVGYLFFAVYANRSK